MKVWAVVYDYGYEGYGLPLLITDEHSKALAYISKSFSEMEPDSSNDQVYRYPDRPYGSVAIHEYTLNEGEDL